MSTPPEPITPPATPQLNEHGFPDATPLAEMTQEQQTAYWKHQSRKHEARAQGALSADEVKRLQERDAALKAIEDEKLTAEEKARLDIAAAATARAEAEKTAQEATRRALLLEIAMDKGLTSAQAARLQGSTKEELEADADNLKSLFAPAAPETRGPQLQHSGSAPKPATNLADGEARYRARHGGTN